MELEIVEASLILIPRQAHLQDCLDLSYTKLQLVLLLPTDTVRPRSLSVLSWPWRHHDGVRQGDGPNPPDGIINWGLQHLHVGSHTRSPDRCLASYLCDPNRAIVHPT